LHFLELPVLPKRLPALLLLLRVLLFASLSFARIVVHLQGIDRRPDRRMFEINLAISARLQHHSSCGPTLLCSVHLFLRCTCFLRRRLRCCHRGRHSTFLWTAEKFFAANPWQLDFELGTGVTAAVLPRHLSSGIVRNTMQSIGLFEGHPLG
jgi:hypothetical protein